MGTQDFPNSQPSDSHVAVPGQGALGTVSLGNHQAPGYPNWGWRGSPHCFHVKIGMVASVRVVPTSLFWSTCAAQYLPTVTPKVRCPGGQGDLGQDKPTTELHLRSGYLLCGVMRWKKFLVGKRCRERKFPALSFVPRSLKTVGQGTRQPEPLLCSCFHISSRLAF